MPTVHRANRRLIHTALVAATAAALVLPGSAVAADNASTSASAAAVRAAALARFPGFATIADSAQLSTPVALHGVLRNAAGDALAGAPVLLSAWPTPAQLDAIPDGADIPLTPIAQTVTDAAGRYALRASMTPALAALLGADGLDVELDVFDGARHHVFMSQIAPVRDTGAWVRGLLSATTETITSGRGEGNRWNVSLTRDGGQPFVVDPARVGVPTLNMPARRVAYPGCSNFTKLPSKIVWEVVSSGLASNGVRMETLYTKGAWTESSTGFSYNGGVSFLQNGARTRTATLTLGFHNYRAKRGQSVHKEFLANRVHHVASRHCAVNAHSHDNVEQIATSPGAMLGGFDDQTPLESWQCDPRFVMRGNGDYVSTENARAKHYSSGFGFSPTATSSFTGGTTSGYNDSTKVTFVFGEARDGYWCGDTNFPALPGQRVQAFRR